jgi:hypothetical protein
MPTPQELTTQELTAQELTAQEFTPEKLTAQELTAQEFTPEKFGEIWMIENGVRYQSYSGIKNLATVCTSLSPRPEQLSTIRGLPLS